MSNTEIVKKSKEAKIEINNNSKLSTVEKDIAIYRKRRTYINELGDCTPLKVQEPATIILTHKKIK